MARVTSSRDRSKGRAKRPVTTSKGRPNRQRVSTAQVSSSESRATGGTARVTRNQDARRPPSGAGRVDNTNVGPKNTGRSLPAEGGSNAGSPRAQNQRAWTRDAGARAQLGRTVNAGVRMAARMAGVDRQSVAERKQAAAAQGTKGEGVREGRPRPEMTRTGSNSTASGRIQPVSVRDITNRPSQLTGSQAALPPGRQGGAATTSRGGATANREAPRPRPGGRVVVDESPRLPAGRQGGPLSNGSERPRPRPDLRPRVTGPAAGQPNSARPSAASQKALPPSQPPARRTAAQAKLDQAAKGTSGGTRVGQSASVADQRYGANVVNQAVARAVRTSRLIKAGQIGGGLLTGLGIADGLRRNLNPKDNILLDLKNLGTGIYNATTPKGGTKRLYEGESQVAQAGNRRVMRENAQNGSRRTGPAVPERLKKAPTTTSAPSRPSQAEQAPARPSSAPSRSSAPTTPSRPQRPAAAAPRPQAQPSSVDTNPYGKAQGDPKRFNTQADLGIPPLKDVPDYSHAKTSGRFVQEFPEPEAPKRRRRRAVGRDEMIQDNLRR